MLLGNPIPLCKCCLPITKLSCQHIISKAGGDETRTWVASRTEDVHNLNIAPLVAREYFQLQPDERKQDTILVLYCTKAGNNSCKVHCHSVTLCNSGTGISTASAINLIMMYIFTTIHTYIVCTSVITDYVQSMTLH